MSCYRHTKEYCGCHWSVLRPCGFRNGGHRAVELPASGRRSATVDCNGVSQSAARIRIRSHCALPCLLTSTALSCPAHAANTWHGVQASTIVHYSTKQHAASRHLSRLCSVHRPCMVTPVSRA